MQGRDQQIEHVARAFFCVDNEEQFWDFAPAEIKAEFRRLACDAIALVTSNRDSRAYRPAKAGPSHHLMIAAR